MTIWGWGLCKKNPGSAQDLCYLLFLRLRAQMWWEPKTKCRSQVKHLLFRWRLSIVFHCFLFHFSHFYRAIIFYPLFLLAMKSEVIVNWCVGWDPCVWAVSLQIWTLVWDVWVCVCFWVLLLSVAGLFKPLKRGVFSSLSPSFGW